MKRLRNRKTNKNSSGKIKAKYPTCPKCGNRDLVLGKMFHCIESWICPTCREWWSR